nr:MAG: hypothetical protein BECKTUN1418F_GA0071002_102212 [Candidatus Kentron sp. TUN]VFK54437.1 MAG: hypothetical protein BECKTUN1418D_GA0071000_10237 [Candidatus Kentron sp. TUN]
MSGNVCRIGMVMTTMPNPRAIIPRGCHLALTASIVVVRSSGVRLARAPLIAVDSSQQATATTTLASVVSEFNRDPGGQARGARWGGRVRGEGGDFTKSGQEGNWLKKILTRGRTLDRAKF